MPEGCNLKFIKRFAQSIGTYVANYTASHHKGVYP